MKALHGRRRRLDSPSALAAFLSGLIHDLAEGRVGPDLAKVIFYGCSVQRGVVELAERADVERRLVEVERMIELARRRA